MRRVFRRILKVATEMVEQTDSGRLFQRDVAQDWKALAPALVLALGTDRLLSLFDLSERAGSDVLSMEWGQTGCFSRRVLYTNNLILNNILHFMGSQCLTNTWSGRPTVQPMGCQAYSHFIHYIHTFSVLGNNMETIDRDFGMHISLQFLIKYWKNALYPELS